MTDPSTAPGTIVVSGTGRVSVVPDVAELRLGVAITQPTVALARSVAAEAMAAVLAAVLEAGVVQRDVRTTLLSVQPRYDYRDGRAPKLTGYDLSNVVEVTVRDLGTSAPSWMVPSARGRRAWTACRSGSPIRAMPNVPRGWPLSRRRARAPRSSLKRPGWRSPAWWISGRAAARRTGRMAKAERMMLAADSGTPMEAGATEISVTVSVAFRIA